MILTNLVAKSNIVSELTFQTARSSGAGGQNVNKVETKVEVYWNIIQSSAINDEQRSILLDKLKNKIDSEGVLKLSSSKTRSQIKNKEDVIDKLFFLIEKSLIKSLEEFPLKFLIQLLKSVYLIRKN